MSCDDSHYHTSARALPFYPYLDFIAPVTIKMAARDEVKSRLQNIPTEPERYTRHTVCGAETACVFKYAVYTNFTLLASSSP